MDRLPDLSQLDWGDLDPATRPAVDPAGVAELVRTLPPAAEVPPPGTDWRLVSYWFDELTAALAGHLGDWVVGWGFTVAMEDYQGRGLIPVWRLNRHTVTTPAGTLTRFADAVVAWHDLLVELATDARGRFAAAAPAGTGAPPAWRAVRRRDHISFIGTPPDRRLPFPWQLSWADIVLTDPVFVPETVAAVVADLVAAAEPPAPDADWRLKDLWMENLTAELVEKYGRWAVGWHWSTGEGDLGGGPIGSWCCYRDSARTPEVTVTAIADSVVEWHDWLDDLTERFGRFLPLPAGEVDGWERAVAHLVTAVGDRTLYESGWYGCVRTVLTWFLEAAGIAPDRRRDLLDQAVGGRFASWAEPSRAVVQSFAEQVAVRVADDRT